ncbi:RNA polymerase II elongation factor, partial [Tulasnella sp. 427]
MAVGVESLTAQIKQLQNAIQNRQWEDAANVLKLLKKVDATEELLRATKAGVAVGKIRSCENAAVSQLSKEVVTKWKSQVEEIKRKRGGGGSTTSTAAASPAAGSTPAGGASPAPANGASQKAATKVNAPATKISIPATAGPSSSAPAQSASASSSVRRDSIDFKSPTGPMDPRNTKTDGIKQGAITVGDKVRDKCIEMAYDAIVFDSPAPSELIMSRAKAIEKSCFNEFGAINGDYRTKIRRLVLNLKDKNNPSLRHAVVSGDLPVERFCQMSNAEMASDELKKANELLNKQNLHDALAAGEQEAETDAFQCGRCKQRKTRYRQAQTRSADEPMTTFVTCTNCGNRWKF